VSIKVDIDANGTMIVRFPARTWELAHEVVSALKEEGPEGYRLVESQLKPRGLHKSGRRCNLRLVLIHVDDRVTQLATSGAKAFFEPYALRAQGVDDDS
jgi:hypothetical protein